MLTLSCPACGAALPFKSRVSVFAVCSYCAATVVRHDLELETLGKMAALPADTSPLQIGTAGQYDGKRFELVGRLKISWEDGTWNEWYALFDDGRDGWLAEAQGFFMMSFAAPAPPSLPAREDIRVGMSLPLAPRQSFEVDDIKETVCVGSEGELTLSGAKGKKGVSVDLSGPDDRFAGIDYGEDGTRVYIGKYVEFDALRLTSLREIDGW